MLNKSFRLKWQNRYGIYLQVQWSIPRYVRSYSALCKEMIVSIESSYALEEILIILEAE